MYAGKENVMHVKTHSETHGYHNGKNDGHERTCPGAVSATDLPKSQSLRMAVSGSTRRFCGLMSL